MTAAPTTAHASSSYALRHVATGTGEAWYGEWTRPSAPAGLPVLALHGISSTHLLWQWAAAAPLAPRRLVAPDQRGRGARWRDGGASGIASHVDDALALLDALGLEQVCVAGMSMGGYVAVRLAQAAPDRVASLVLVDGGAPFPPLPTTGDAADVRERLADRFARLRRPYASTADYRQDFLLTAPLLADVDDALLTRYLSHDLEPGPDGMVVRLDGDRVTDDAVDLFGAAGQAALQQAFAGLRCPTTLLVAEWSRGAGSPPGYPDALLAEHVATVPQLQARRLAGTDHASIIMTADPAAEVARAVLLASTSG